MLEGIPVSQLMPVYPETHLHSYALILLIHSALWRHGLLEHSSVSTNI